MTTREHWLETMLHICDPVLFSLSQGILKETMPVEKKENKEDRSGCTYLEAFGRCVLGLAPWLSAKGLSKEETEKQSYYKHLVQRCISMAVNPESPDYMNFCCGTQPLVDAAFLAQGIMRAPKELYDELDPETKKQLVDCMKSSRAILPWRWNWLLFSGMVEAFLHYANEDYDKMRIDYSLFAHEKFYKGDGAYGDGEFFHFDYYNSFVIQPMMYDILKEMKGINKNWDDLYEKEVKRASHSASILEQLIMPDGTYPLVGRSLTYRFGAFHLLSQMALEHNLEDCTPPQVRCALTSVIDKMMSYDNFDENGWLKIGIAGAQPKMGEEYISTGSLYLCTAIFLPLGLSPSDEFWAGEDDGWRQKKLWSGENLERKHCQD